MERFATLSLQCLLIATSLSACTPRKNADAAFRHNISAEAMCQTLSFESPHGNIEITSSKPVASTDTLPSFCQITGKISPEIGFEARYPLIQWNGKFFQAGCGGFCGVINAEKETHSNAILHALRRGYATITTDGGHQGEHQGDASWAKDNPAAEKIYAGDVLPLTHQAGHQLIESIYGKKANYSYFSGCSNGGRLGAIAAQRYPDLFDGIVSGCPVLQLSVNGGVFGAWVVQANSDGKGGRILDHAFTPKLPVLEANAYAQCDGLDGSVDGVIADPYSCQISLEPIPDCGKDNRPDCLTRAERAVVQKWYQGPVDSQNRPLFFGMSPGSERFWAHWYLGTETFPGAGTLLAERYGAYLGFPQDPENFSALDFSFDTDVEKLTQQGELFDAANPDLSAFHKSGGKLIMWHGMSDPLVLPQQSPAYYNRVKAQMGDDVDVNSFFRLFMAPAIGHCWELPAALPDQMSMLEVLENWVERDLPPDLISLQSRDGNSGTGQLLPYPEQASYTSAQ